MDEGDAARAAVEVFNSDDFVAALADLAALAAAISLPMERVVCPNAGIVDDDSDDDDGVDAATGSDRARARSPNVLSELLARRLRPRPCPLVSRLPPPPPLPPPLAAAPLRRRPLWTEVASEEAVLDGECGVAYESLELVSELLLESPPSRPMLMCSLEMSS